MDTATSLKVMKTFGDNEYAPRVTDIDLMTFKENKKMEDSVKNAKQFFDNDIQTQAITNLEMSPQSQSVNTRGITWNIPMLEQTWRSSPYLKRAIQWNSSKLLMKGVDINSNDDKLSSKELNAIQAKLMMNSYRPLRRMFEFGYLYGGAGAIKIVKGKTNESDFYKPFNPNDINKGQFLGIKPLTRWYMIEPALDKGLVKEVDPEKGIYDAQEIGQPMYYRVNFSGGLSGWSGLNEAQMKQKGLNRQGSQILVHRSWLYIFNPYPLGHIETQVERYWSESMMEVATRDMNRHEIIWTATGKSAVKNNMGVVTIHGLDSVVRNNRVNTIINDKIALMKYGSNHGIIALGEKDKFEFASGELGGNKDVIEQSMRHISLAFRTPLNDLFNDTSNYDENSYLQILDMVKDTQMSEVAPILEDLIKIYSKHLFGKSAGDFSFEFKPILTLTPKAKAEVIQIMLKALSQAHQEGFLDTLTGIQALPDILNNPSNIFTHLNEKYISMIKKGADDGSPITANWFKIELAKALNQFQNNEQNGTSGVEDPRSSTARVNKGGDPTKSSRTIKRHSLNPEKGKV